MTRDVNVDQILDSWFIEGPTQLPDRTVASIAARLDDVHQQGPLGLPGRSRMPRLSALTGAAIVLVVGVVFLGVYANGTGIGVKPSPTRSASTSARTSGGMWPQTSLAEIRQAQELADAGDPGHTWQVDTQLTDGLPAIEQGGQVELVDRFLGEVLGWEDYLLWEVGQGQVSDLSYSAFSGQLYLRCESGRTNPLYPPGPEPDRGELCAPTLDDLQYESVRA